MASFFHTPRDRQFLRFLAALLCYFVFSAICSAQDTNAPRVRSVTTTLPNDQRVYANQQYVDLGKDGLAQTFRLRKGEAAYLYAKGRARSSRAETMLDGLRVTCPGGSIVSTQNHVGVDAEWQAVRRLFAAPMDGHYTCRVEAVVFPRTGGSAADYHTYLKGASNTSLVVTYPIHSRAWGTENDLAIAGYGDDCCYGPARDPVKRCRSKTECVYIGSGPAGRQEYLLRSPRLTVPAGKTIDAYSEPELTVCYKGTGSCPKNRHGSGPGGATLDLRLVIQQINANGSVCATSHAPVSGHKRFSISHNEHHKKAHLVAYDIALKPGCRNKQFVIKTYARLVSGNPVKIERGIKGNSGYSTGFAFY